MSVGPASESLTLLSLYQDVFGARDFSEEVASVSASASGGALLLERQIEARSSFFERRTSLDASAHWHWHFQSAPSIEESFSLRERVTIEPSINYK
jgi:hypothetical protein